MKISKEFVELEIPEIQGLTYLHNWKEDGDKNKHGGEIIFYNNGSGKDPLTLESIPNKGYIIDGTKLLHGTARVDPENPPPNLSKDRNYIVRFDH